MASAFDLGTPEALAPGAKTAGVVGNTQDKLAAFRSHASDDVVRKIREATKLLEQRQAARARGVVSIAAATGAAAAGSSGGGCGMRVHGCDAGEGAPRRGARPAGRPAV